MGVLVALRLKVDRTHMWLLAPGICLVCWAIGLGASVSVGMPVGRLALPFWAATAAIAAFGAWRTRVMIFREAARPLLAVTALPIILMPFDFWQGLRNFIGEPAGDGWSYVAFGQYLWEMTKGAEGHFAPLHQYASHLDRTRFISSALLGAISPLTGLGGDTQAAAGYFVAWTLFVFGASCAFLGLATGLRGAWLIVFCALAVASPWVVGAIHMHNYDNLMAISFLPIVMGILGTLPRPDWRGLVSLGGVLAAAVYIYPEMAAFVLLGGALGVARRMWAGAEKGAWIGLAVGGGVVATLAVLPAASDLQWFVSSQLTNATASVAGARPGEGGFSELLKVHEWGATVWGLRSSASELGAGAGSKFLRHALGLMLWALACAGLVQALVDRRWDIAAIAIVMIAGALVMAVRQQYSYGAYKFLLLGWWSLVWLIVTGAQGMVARPTASIGVLSARTSRFVVAGLLTVLGTAVLAAGADRTVMFHRTQPATSIEPYRAVLAAEQVIGDDPIVVAVNDDLANQWAVYFMRRHSILLAGYRGYMAFPHVVPVMEQAATADVREVRYVLTDEESGAHEIVWARGPYVLWRVPATGAAFLRNVTNPNGLERMNGKSFFWIGQGDTTLDVVATSAGEATFSGRFLLGPSLPEVGARRLLLGSSGVTDQTFTVAREGHHSFALPVNAGSNRVSIRSLDRPSVAVTSNGDRRPLLVGVEGLSVSLGQP